ncbi:hypothetical protein KIW84_021338 [Lathyrus oleraceus]|uniref:SWIM-type domain-containing protein n=1 Tax=Pisum sativum TaxID=3888 RepID=A0A9D4Y8T0_PEA|nr:hypothetical protein KIW84_021338 [Pisum sativum]
MKTTSANTKKRSSSVKTSSVKCPKSEDSQHFSVTLHHGGEFYRVSEEEIIYRGGTDTTVNGIHVSNWNMDNIEKLLSRLGYKAECVRVWTKVLEIQDGFFLIRKDDDAVDDVALYLSVMNVKGDLYVEHSTGNMDPADREPKCVNDDDHPPDNGIVRLDEEKVEGLDDSEDERATAYFDGFEGIDVTKPIREEFDGFEGIDVTKPIREEFDGFEGIDVTKPIREEPNNSKEEPNNSKEEPNKSMDSDDVYYSDELNSSDPDDSCDEERPKYARFRKEHLNKDFIFKWGMEFNTLDDFRAAIQSFNATILAARDKPILTMCEWIRKYLMNRLSTSASKLENWPHKVMPIPRRRLDNEVLNSGHWLPTWSIAETFQVTHSYNTHEFIVDIAKRSCSCNFWELVGIPCRHAVAALSYRKQNPDEFVDACYTREKFALCYGFSVSPINGQDMWPEVDMEPPLPPAYKNGPGRPKKIRIRESGEDGARKRRSGVAYKCTKCDNFGHNAMTCKATTQDPNALKRKRKPKKGHVPTATDMPTANDMPTASDMPAPTASDMPAPTATDMTVPTNVPVPTDPQPPTDMPVPTIMSQTGSSVAASITKQSRKRVEKKPIIKRRQSERIKLSWFKRPITGEGISSDKPITLPENEDIPTSK